MKIVSITSQKGGVGKTTLSTCLAVEAERAGRTAAIIALDPQDTITFWKNIRGADKGPSVITAPIKRIDEMLGICAKSNVDLVIIDGAAIAEDMAHAAAARADFVLMPTRPSVFDTMAMSHTLKIVRTLDKPHAVILTFVAPQGSEIADAAAAIGQIGAPLCPVTIGNRKAYFRAQGFGQAAQEYEPIGTAANEIRQLYAYLESFLFKPRRTRRTASTAKETNA